MKKLILSIVLASVAMAASAQDSPIFLQRGTQSFSGYVSVSNNSLIKTTSGILYNYYFHDDVALRANVRLGYNNKTEEYDYETIKSEVTNINNDFRLGIGLQKSLVKSRRFNGYIAIDALAGLQKGKTIQNDHTTETSAIEFGVRPAMGIEFHFVNDFFVGLEWGYDVIFNNLDDNDHHKVNNTILDIADLSSACFRVGFNF
jgi:hypothetical protein